MNDSPMGVNQHTVEVGDLWKKMSALKDGIKTNVGTLEDQQRLADLKNNVDTLASAFYLASDAAFRTKSRNIDAGLYDAVMSVSLLPVNEKNFSSPLSTTLFDNKTGRPMLSYSGTGLSVNYEAEIGRVVKEDGIKRFVVDTNDRPIQVLQREINIGAIWNRIKNIKDGIDFSKDDKLKALKVNIDTLLKAFDIPINAAMQTQHKDFFSGTYDAVLSLGLVPVNERNFSSAISTTLFDNYGKPLLSYNGQSLALNYKMALGQMVDKTKPGDVEIDMGFESKKGQSVMRITMQDVPIGEIWAAANEALDNTFKAYRNKPKDQIPEEARSNMLHLDELKKNVDALRQAFNLTDNAAFQTQEQAFLADTYDAIASLNMVVPSDTKNLSAEKFLPAMVSTVLFDNVTGKPMLSYNGQHLSLNFRAELGTMMPDDGGRRYFVSNPGERVINITQQDLPIGKIWQAVRTAKDNIKIKEPTTKAEQVSEPKEKKELRELKQNLDTLLAAFDIPVNAAIQIQKNDQDFLSGTYDAIASLSMVRVDERNPSSIATVTLLNNRTGKPLLSYNGQNLAINYQARVGTLDDKGGFDYAEGNPVMRVLRKDIPIGELWQRVLKTKENFDRAKDSDARKIKSELDMLIEAIDIPVNTAIQTQSRDFKSGTYDAIASLNMLPINNINSLSSLISGLSGLVSITLFDNVTGKPMLSYNGQYLSLNFQTKLGKMVDKSGPKDPEIDLQFESKPGERVMGVKEKGLKIDWEKASKAIAEVLDKKNSRLSSASEAAILQNLMASLGLLQGLKNLQIDKTDYRAGTYDTVASLSMVPVVNEKNLSSLVNLTLFDINSGKPVLNYNAETLGLNHTLSGINATSGKKVEMGG
ncbi:MAG: hypothetical protein NT033_06460, partial [Candidatus Omnitrophica bacterium]|nr:hypothetical protein [Candidatus Omnitrophota bacterium]